MTIKILTTLLRPTSGESGSTDAARNEQTPRGVRAVGPELKTLFEEQWTGRSGLFVFQSGRLGEVQGLRAAARQELKHASSWPKSANIHACQLDAQTALGVDTLA